MIASLTIPETLAPSPACTERNVLQVGEILRGTFRVRKVEVESRTAVNSSQMLVYDSLKMFNLILFSLISFSFGVCVCSSQKKIQLE